MFASGRSRGRGRGRSAPSGDMGFCAVHQKRRNRTDLMPMGGNPGSMQCRPGKECRGREQAPSGMCSLHHRRRNLTHMREVRRGVWECLPDSACRLQGDAPARGPSGGSGRNRADGGGRRRGGGGGGGRGGGGREGGGGGAQGFSPLRSFSGGSNRRGRQARRGERAGGGADDNGTQWNPQSTVHSMLGANAAQSRQQRQAASRREGRATWSLMKVWCARHGKQLPLADTEKLEECCYACTDTTECVSSPLPNPTELRKSGCKEVLCVRHHTLRSVGFVEVTKDKLGYQCVPKHPCRHATLGQLTALTSDVYAGAFAGGAAVGNPGDTTYQTGASAPHTAPVMSTRGAARPNAPEAASSFFA